MVTGPFSSWLSWLGLGCKAHILHDLNGFELDVSFEPGTDLWLVSFLGNESGLIDLSLELKSIGCPAQSTVCVLAYFFFKVKMLNGNKTHTHYQHLSFFCWSTPDLRLDSLEVYDISKFHIVKSLCFDFAHQRLMREICPDFETLRSWDWFLPASDVTIE